MCLYIFPDYCTMLGRRSSDKNFFFGYPAKLDPNQLPTESDIVSHALFVRREKIAIKEWKQNTPVGEVAKKVAEDVIEVWDKTDIAHYGTTNRKWVNERVENLIMKSREVLKIPKDRRNNVELSEVWGTLFDISLCPHKSKKTCECPHCVAPHPECCTCPQRVKVPDLWRSFLWDQREGRVMYLSTIDRQRMREERDMLEKVVRDQERREAEAERIKKQRAREGELGGRASGSDIDDSETDIGDGSENDESEDSDSDWEDMKDTSDKVIEYNTIQLRRFSRECDRNKVSNRGGAKIGNSLLKDLELVTENDKKMLICPNKLRRERLKWGAKIVKKHSEKEDPVGWYFDGKKCDTLIRDTKYVNVQVRGKRGRGSKKQVTTTGTKVETVDHYSIVCEPGGDYESHVSPKSGTGLDIAAEIVSTIRERGGQCKVLGCDGTAVNTGIHNGALRGIQLELGTEAHQFICLLHLNELFLRHRQTELDGPTTGPQAWSGPLGRALVQDVWLQPVVSFTPITGNIKTMPKEVVDDLSRDARILYKLGLVVQSGVVLPEVVSATIGPPLHARWLTTAARDLRVYISTRKPSKAFCEIVSLLVKFYIPNFFTVKEHSHCQQGALNLFNMIKLSRDLLTASRTTVERVLQDNSYWAHPENILIAMLGDDREVIRRRAVLLIRSAREKYDQTDHPRQFRPPVLNFKAEFYFDMVKWDKVVVTEPPLTMDLDEIELLEIIGTPLQLPHYPCHTQHVERVVPLVTESAMQRIGFDNRHRWILSTLESRKLCPSFTTKNDDTAMD